MSVDQTTDAPAIEAPLRRPMSLQLKVGLVITGSIVLLGLLAPWISPHPWDTISMRTRFVPPNATYWFGTDEYGRDVLSRLLMGTRLSLTMGVSATLVSLAVGVPMGLAAGYFRGWIDEALMRLADVLMAVPPIMLGLLVLAVTPPALWKTALAVGFVYIPPIARLARSVTLTLANEEFIQAAKPSSDWGLMISEARSFIDRAPWIALAPGFAMCLLVIGINLLGDGARERLDPRLKSRMGKR